MSQKFELKQNGRPKWAFAFVTWNDPVEDEKGTVSVDDIRLAIHYHFNPRYYPANLYFREQHLSKSLIDRFARKMVESVPLDYVPKEHPWDPWERFPDPGCPECRGYGGCLRRILGTSYTDFVMCRCVTGPVRGDPECNLCRGTGKREIRPPDSEFPENLYPRSVECECLRRAR